MAAYLIRRIIRLMVILLITLTLVFTLFRLVPGGLEYTVAGGYASTEEIERVREQLGLNEPLPVQFGRYLLRMLHGDFGRSQVQQKPVLLEILKRMPASITLLLVTIAMILTLGLPTGITSAVTGRASFIFPLFILYSIPHFVIALLMITILSAQLHLLPAFGFRGISSLIMPSFATAAPFITITARMTRASILDVIKQDYVGVARSKGIGESKVVLKHVLRNASLPILTSLGMQIGYLLGGNIVIETVFSWPGIGQLLVQSAVTRDYPTLQGLTIIFTAGFLIVNLLVDIFYAVLDPRIRYG
jgi:ABC-type dipeptide/oligopeptide/nickel transport system permease component